MASFFFLERRQKTKLGKLKGIVYEEEYKQAFYIIGT
jgi:hypothetical protein